ncbi:MAG: hypothetical protein FJ145_05955 [Deltaproteobacteria bacterium]|nr:hypothetical protein [Deltaproteobacteria bacterium]
MISRIKALFELDLRSLGCFRIAVAAVVLADVLLRALDMDALYGARGVLPPTVASTLWDWRTVYSPFTLLSDAPLLLWTGFTLIGFAAVLLGLGIAPRLAAAIAWFLLAGLQNRNPPLYMVGDRYLLLLLMWCVLLPTGARFSLRPAAPGVTTLRSWAAAGLLLQLFVAYTLTGFKKTGAEWFDGTAIWYALNLPDNVRWLGSWLALQPDLTVPLSHIVKWGEALMPVVLFSPWCSGVCRLMVVGFFWLFHLGIEATMQIGIFQFVGIAAWTAALPPLVWQWFETRAKRRETSTTRYALVGFSWTVDRLAIGLLFYMLTQLVFNVGGIMLAGVPDPGPRWVNFIAHTLHFQEGWAMYMRVSRVQRWVVVPGRLIDGTEIDALRETPLVWNKPENFQSAQGGFRWTHYLTNATLKASFEAKLASTHEPLLGYLCRRWNQRHGGRRRLEHVELSIVNIATPELGVATPSAQVERNVANRDCSP